MTHTGVYMDFDCFRWTCICIWERKIAKCPDELANQGWNYYSLAKLLEIKIPKQVLYNYVTAE